MANWSGTYTITAGATGTSSGGNTSTTFNNTVATWPTGAQGLTNFTVRILTGTGAGQTRVITGNTATQLTVAAWTITPDATSTYEIVLIFKNGDHITAQLILSTNIITEIEDSAMVLVDGAFAFILQNSCTIRWQKTETTIAGFQANNRTVAGTHGFWTRIELASTLSVVPQIEYLKIFDAGTGLLVRPSAAVGSGSTIRKVWFEGVSVTTLSITGAALSVDMVSSKIFARNCLATPPTFCGNASPGRSQAFERCWFENSPSGGPVFSVVPTQSMRESVFKNTWSNRNVNLASGVTARIEDCYIKAQIDSAVINGGLNTRDAGNHHLRRNVIVASRANFGPAGVNVNNPTLVSAFNDMYAREGSAFMAFDIAALTFYSVATSDNDYIAGMNGAVQENIDTTAAATSTATPAQYQNLSTARTNPKSVKNRPATVDNVVQGTPTGNSQSVTFDCANGAVSGQGSTTVNSDSNSGQPVVNVASTTGFAVGEIVEIGYGTARAELIRVAAIGAGTITSETNLVNTHTAAQGDTVKKRLRHYGLPFIKYGTASGVYNMQTNLPKVEDWGLIYTEIKVVFDGVTYGWNRTGHSVTLNKLEPSTTYYAKPCFYTPLGELVEGDEISFTTATSDAYSDPGVDNVRLGTAYKFNSLTNNRTGTVRVPGIANVKVGFAYDANDALTGTYDGSDRWTDPGDNNVREAIAYKANSTTNNKTGRVGVPLQGEVKIGTAFETDDGTIGTYDGSERYTDVDEDVVLSGFNYRYNSLINNRMGNFTTPDTSQIAAAVWGHDLSGFIPGSSAGYMLKRTFWNLKQAIGAILSKL